jgi:hypothetical protein
MAVRIEGELIAIPFQSRISNRRRRANSVQPRIVRNFGSVNISSRRIVLSESESNSELTGVALHERTSTHACPRNVDSALPATDVPPIMFAFLDHTSR